MCPGGEALPLTPVLIVGDGMALGVETGGVSCVQTDSARHPREVGHRGGQMQLELGLNPSEAARLPTSPRAVLQAVGHIDKENSCRVTE